MSRQLAAVLLVAAGLLLIAPLAHGTTLYVANNGVDGPSCGTKTSPCRSIGQTIANAVAGDAIVVGPGRYGDLNGNGVLGEPGEENPDVFSPGCGCVLGVNKTLTLTSSNGAAATVIDATSVASIQNVLIIGNGVQFGKAGKGFTVTSTAAGRDPTPAVLDVVVRPSPTVPAGIVVDASNVAITGNQVVFQLVDALVDISADQSFTITDISTFGSGSGIYAVENDGETVTIQGNQVIGGWEFGIRALSSGKTVKGNTVSLNLLGVAVSGKSSVEGNVIAGNFSTGIAFEGSATVIGNDVH